MIDHTLENLKMKDYWDTCVKYFNSIRIPTLVKYLQYLKNDLTFTDLKKATLQDLQTLEEFCKKDAHERHAIMYKWTCKNRYNEDYFKDHAAKGRKTKEKHYGKDFDKLMMQKAKEAGLEKDSAMKKHNAEKRYRTKLEKYGKDGLSQIARDVAFKAIKTKRYKYGENYFSEQALKNFPKIEATKMERYGTLFPKIEIKTSKEEKSVLNFIKSIYRGCVEENKKGLLSDIHKELDIYIPEKNFAIEYDGWFFHSEANRFYRFNEETYTIENQKKLAMHRYNKTVLCEEANIRLIHILDLDWRDPIKQIIYKSLIAGALGIYKTKYFARKLFFSEIDSKSARKFLNSNHLQGAANASRYFALLDKNQNIIQVMSFQLHSNHNYNECELNRMATILNTQVIGGFSKLLKNSLKVLNVKTCTSYIDRSIFDGKGYYKVGFEKVSETQPCYFYVYKNRVHRREFGMRKNIEKLFNAGILSYWNPDETERINMLKNRIPRIWDCGKIKVRYELS